MEKSIRIQFPDRRALMDFFIEKLGCKTRSGLAKKMGVTRQYLYLIEGKRKSRQFLSKIAAMINCKLGVVLIIEGDEREEEFFLIVKN